MPRLRLPLSWRRTPLDIRTLLCVKPPGTVRCRTAPGYPSRSRNVALGITKKYKTPGAHMRHPGLVDNRFHSAVRESSELWSHIPGTDCLGVRGGYCACNSPPSNDPLVISCLNQFLCRSISFVFCVRFDPIFADVSNAHAVSISVPEARYDRTVIAGRRIATSAN